MEAMTKLAAAGVAAAVLSAVLKKNTPELAQSALHLLLSLIENGDGGGYTRRLITPSIIERSTCRAL